MINRLFRYFTGGRYERALKLARTLTDQRLSEKEMSFVIFTSALSDFFRGGSDSEVQNWLAEALKNLYKRNPAPNEFLVLMMAFEGSKLFQADPEQGITMLEKAKAGAKNTAQSASVLFFIALFEMNMTSNYPEVIKKLFNVRAGLEGNHEYSMFTFIRFWNEVMIGHVSNQLGKFKESEILSRQIMLHCKNLGFDPLLENVYMNLAFAHLGLEDKERTQYFLTQNIQYWEEKENHYKKGMALIMAASLMFKLDEKEKGLEYLEQRKKMGLPLESQWYLAEEALKASGMEEKAAEWEWKEEI